MDVKMKARGHFNIEVFSEGGLDTSPSHHAQRPGIFAKPEGRLICM
jgi:hypothetical protein